MKSKRTQILWGICLPIALLATFLLLNLSRNLPMPNTATATAGEVGQYISGRSFRNISPGERRRFMTEIRKKGLKPEDIAASLPAREKENFLRNMEFFKQERLKEFFDMPPDKQQAALKEAARDMKQEHAMRTSAGSAPSHKKSLEGESPEDRARSIEFARQVKNYLKTSSTRKNR